MRNYIATFKRVFPGIHYVFASITLIAGIFTGIYALGVSQGFFLRSWITGIDRYVLATLLNQRGNTRSGFFLFFTYLGNWQVMITLAIVTIAIMLLTNKTRAVGFFAITLIIGQLASLLFKYLLQRSRPDSAIALINQGGHSFPSGHAMGSFIFYGVLAYFIYILATHRWQKLLTVLCISMVIGLVGFSRLYLGVHWLSDVVAGWLMGATLLIVFIVFFEHRKRLFPTVYETRRFPKKVVLMASIALIIAELIFISWFYLTHPFKGSNVAPLPGSIAMSEFLTV